LTDSFESIPGKDDFGLKGHVSSPHTRNEVANGKRGRFFRDPEFRFKVHHSTKEGFVSSKLKC